VDPALVMLRESPRGKAYRLSLEPGQTVRLPPNASDLFVVCLTDGTVTPAQRSLPGDGMKCTRGDFRLLERPDAPSLKNEGAGRVELTVIAVR